MLVSQLLFMCTIILSTIYVQEARLVLQADNKETGVTQETDLNQYQVQQFKREPVTGAYAGYDNDKGNYNEYSDTALTVKKKTGKGMTMIPMRTRQSKKLVIKKTDKDSKGSANYPVAGENGTQKTQPTEDITKKRLSREATETKPQKLKHKREKREKQNRNKNAGLISIEVKSDKPSDDKEEEEEEEDEEEEDEEEEDNDDDSDDTEEDLDKRTSIEKARKHSRKNIKHKKHKTTQKSKKGKKRMRPLIEINTDGDVEEEGVDQDETDCDCDDEDEENEGAVIHIGAYHKKGKKGRVNNGLAGGQLPLPPPQPLSAGAPGGAGGGASRGAAEGAPAAGGTAGGPPAPGGVAGGPPAAGGASGGLPAAGGVAGAALVAGGAAGEPPAKGRAAEGIPAPGENEGGQRPKRMSKYIKRAEISPYGSERIEFLINGVPVDQRLVRNNTELAIQFF